MFPNLIILVRLILRLIFSMIGLPNINLQNGLLLSLTLCSNFFLQTVYLTLSPFFKLSEIFNFGWEMFQPTLKSKLLQPLSVATLLLKHMLFLQPGIFFRRSKKIYYVPIITITLIINLCATAIVGT